MAKLCPVVPTELLLNHKLLLSESQAKIMVVLLDESDVKHLYKGVSVQNSETVC